jgi:Zn-finger domain-containing protein
MGPRRHDIHRIPHFVRAGAKRVPMLDRLAAAIVAENFAMGVRW